MTTKSITLASDGQKKQLARLLEEVGEDVLDELQVSKEGAQRLLGKGGEFKFELAQLLAPLMQRFTLAPNVVVVPDLSAVELTAVAKRDLQLTHIDSDYERWDYYTGVNGLRIEGRGKKFEVLIWKPELGPNDVIASKTVRGYFQEQGGFHGHAGAFTQWRRACGLQGYHASLLDDNACWRHPDGRLGVPSSYFVGGRRELYRFWLDYDWHANWSFVAFREVSLHFNALFAPCL